MLSKFIIFLPGDGESLPDDFRPKGAAPPFGKNAPILLFGLPDARLTAANARIALIWEPKNGEAFPPNVPLIKDFLASANFCAVAYHHELGTGRHPQQQKLIKQVFVERPVFEYRYHHSASDRYYPHFRDAATARSAADFNFALTRLAQSLEPQVRDVGTRLLLRLLPKYLDPTTRIEEDEAENSALNDLHIALDLRLSSIEASAAYDTILDKYITCCKATTAEAMSAGYAALKALLMIQMRPQEQADI